MTDRQPTSALASAFYASPSEAEQALLVLEDSGVPRDLIEIAVTEEGAAHYDGRVRRDAGRETVRYAAIGGLIGLVAGAGASLLMLALPGRTELDGTIVVQLLGPNVSAIAGALLGALLGLFVRREVDPRLHRARGAGTGVLIAARARTQDEAQSLLTLLRTCGGEAARIDGDTPASTEGMAHGVVG